MTTMRITVEQATDAMVSHAHSIGIKPELIDRSHIEQEFRAAFARRATTSEETP